MKIVVVLIQTKMYLLRTTESVHWAPLSHPRYAFTFIHPSSHHPRTDKFVHAWIMHGQLVSLFTLKLSHSHNMIICFNCLSNNHIWVYHLMIMSVCLGITFSNSRIIYRDGIVVMVTMHAKVEAHERHLQYFYENETNHTTTLNMLKLTSNLGRVWGMKLETKTEEQNFN